MKIILTLLASLLFASAAPAQYAKVLPKTVDEGSTSFLSVVFYDEFNQPVVPEAIWYVVPLPYEYLITWQGVFYGIMAFVSIGILCEVIRRGD